MSSSKKILIIEDNESLKDLYFMAFSSREFDVEQAKEGLEGITKAVEFKPDIVLLDLMMPNMSGFEVLDAINKNSSLDTTVFIASNLTDKKNISAALDNGAVYFFKKAEYTPDQIVEKILDYIAIEL